MLDGGVIHERGTCYLPAYMDRLDGGAHEDVLEGAAGLAVEAQLHRPVLDGDRLQAFAVGECGVFNQRDSGGNGDGRERVAAGKSICADGVEAIGQLNGRQCGAIIKSA